MKYLNIAFIAIFAICIISCSGDKTKSSQIKKSESVEVEDEEIEDENVEEVEEDIFDEYDYVESAMTALENGNSSQAVTEIMNAIGVLKSYQSEAEDGDLINNTISKMTKIAESIKSGNKMTADQFDKAIMNLKFFADEELEIEDESIEK